MRNHWDFDGWRKMARDYLARNCLPEEVDWQGRESQSELTLGMAAGDRSGVVEKSGRAVPAKFLDRARAVICHSDPARLSLLYRMAWRMTHGERNLLSNPLDDDVLRFIRLEKAVSRDIHKMKAFVRFREVPDCDNTFIAWFEPTHYIVERAAGFFRDRFYSMNWSILTPFACVHWNQERLQFTAGTDKSEAPDGDNLEELWRTYYANIFNPARLKTAAMQAEMPKKYWKNLPEASLIAPLTHSSGQRTASMLSNAPTVPAARKGRARYTNPHSTTRLHAPAQVSNLDSIRKLADRCRMCTIGDHATQAVVGEGPPDARLMIVGEQPGDKEDLAGRVFVGPAGKVLDQALQRAGIRRQKVFLTNAVKHFKYEERGKFRLHSSPKVTEIETCSHWLKEELRLVDPQVVVAMGATALRSLLGKTRKLTDCRGEPMLTDDNRTVIATWHPAAILRAGTGDGGDQRLDELSSDLALARRLAQRHA